MSGILWSRRRRKIEERRVVYLNDPERNSQYRYNGNKIKTSRYTIWSFLPRVLFEQFALRRANLYFLVMAILSVIPVVSPGLNNPVAAFAPLFFVVSVSAIKEAIEDWRRHQMDNEMNAYEATVLVNGSWKQVEWQELEVGNIIKVLKDNQIPADVMLISTSTEEGDCFLETSNLDGETNLKRKVAASDVLIDFKDNDNSLSAKLGCIECDAPTADLNEFVGKLTYINGTPISLDMENVLLRGCVLKNTEWITGAVVYTGADTRVMQNSLNNRTKFSSLERLVNEGLNLMFLFLAILVVISTILCRVFLSALQDHTYIFPPGDEENLDEEAWIKFWSFTVLYHNIIPISLYVSMEVVKVFHALFINNDLEMYDPITDTPANARTSNLSEELGQIDHIFSDKTGTLTQNVMEFFKCSFNGVSYGTGLSDIAKNQMILAGKVPVDTTHSMAPLSTASEKFPFRDPALHKDLTRKKGEFIREGLLNLCICNTVQPDKDPKFFKGIKYGASSPDEACLVDAAKNLGFILEKRTAKNLTIRMEGQSKPFVVEILAINEFSSDRKSMSVVVRLPDGTVRMYCKGADSVIRERLTPGQSIVDITWQHLEEYSNEGLRTLVLAYKDIPEKDFHSWIKKYNKARLASTHRKEKLKKVAQMIETDMTLLGATAIEDKLQEGVPEAIARLLQGNIKVWVLTGDKMETAINIGYACRIIEKGMVVMIVDGDNPKAVENQLQNAEYSMSQDPTKAYCLVAAGESLKFLTLQQDLAPLLINVTNRCASVICCRLSPIQKAEIVKTVTMYCPTVRTLAIGDGANDVPMIQAANIGVGISGKEGMQAVMASDYSIAQFRFLAKLLLVHGRWSYRRIALIIVYSFYKNVVRSCFQFWWQIVSAWSAGTINDVWSLAGWNTLFTSLPIIIISCLDQDVSKVSSMKMPQLYRHGQLNKEFNLTVFTAQILYAFFTSAVCFFIPLVIWAVNDIISPTGISYGFWDLGFYTFAMAVVVCNFRIYFETSFIHWSVHASVWASILAYIIVMLIYHVPGVTIVAGEPEQMDIIYGIFDTWMFWMCLFVTCAFALVPLYVWNSYNRFWNPETYQIVQELEQQGKVPDTTSQSFSKMLDDEKLKPGPPLTAYYMNQVNRKTGYLGKPEKILGFGFSQSGGQLKWLDRLAKKIRERRRKNKQPGDGKNMARGLVEEEDSDMTDATISTSSTDSSDDFEDGGKGKEKEEGHVSLEDEEMESI